MSIYTAIQLNMKKILLLLISGLVLSCSSEEKLIPVQLTCEYLEDPAVVDVLHPRLSWINQSVEGERGQVQTAWQVRVASSKEKLDHPDLWESDKVMSDQSIRVRYEGKPLISRQECWWQVRVWEKDGKISDWSKRGWWRMGLLQPGDWEATWIGAPWQGEEAFLKPKDEPVTQPMMFGPPSPLLRKNFRIQKEVASAVAFVTGLGYFELYVNGKKVGNDVLVPNQTNYGKRPQLTETLIYLPDEFREYKVMYLAYDIKDQLNQGENAIGGILGNGFYNPSKFWAAAYGSPRFLCQVHITYADGSDEVIVSDGTWKASKGPILMNMVYYGEHYDARKEQPEWCTPSFDDSDWKKVAIRNAPEGKMVAHTAYPDRVTESLAPVSIEKLGDGHFFVDFGVEISGWVRLNQVEGPEGHRIEMKFNGNQYSGDNSYIFSGNGPSSYAPRFNWFVFSGVEIINWPGELKPEYLTAEAVNTFIEPSATFETSNQLFNDINKIWRRSQTDNMHGGIASDCPHRERSGYTGDGQIACITVLHNFDAKNFYQKWVQDMLGAQIAETGYVPNGAPWQPGCGGGPAWGAAICVIPWQYYVHYGSTDMLEDNYEGMKGYIRYMKTWVDDEGIMFSKRTAKDGTVLKWFNLGEWVAPGETVPDEMVHTFYLWYCATITARTAGILNMDKEAEMYEALARTTQQAFQKRFFDEEKGTYGDGGGNILALRMGVPDNQYERVVAALKASIISNKGHLDTGIVGTRFFFEVLAENGLHNLAYEALNKRTEPGFGHWLELGSTTTRERWDERGSHNHPMFGGGLVWFYRNLAGMQADPDQPGYRHIIFRPQVIDQLDFVTYTNNTPYGEAGIIWSNEKGSFTMDISVPVSCSATVYVPASAPGNVFESGQRHDEIPEIEFRQMEDGYAVFEVGSGKYSFKVL
ncbi:MAG: family 78 glycoside hydrolase catalytic domain [Bacteroidales bacterium]|nr:family 78 glycoside hydrolase catalytic domain [Bacteroidales bacterium]